MIDIDELVPESVGGFCGILAPFVAYGLIAISVLINPDFTFAGSSLSDLGAAGAPYNNIFNFGIIIGGLMFILFMISMFEMRESEVGTIGLIGLLAGGICLVLVGIFTQETTPHTILVLLFYSLSIGGMIIYGLDQFLEFEQVWGVLIWSNLGFALIAAGLIYSPLSPSGYAIYEIIGSIPIMQFSIIFGARLFFE